MKPHRYRLFIKASREQVWAGITDPAFTRQYFHATAFESTLEPGSAYRYVMDDDGEAVAGEIEVVEAPSRLVMTWRVLYDPAAADEPPSRVEWTLTEAAPNMTRLDVVHGDLGRSPVTWASVKDGWVWILDNLKTLLETGQALPDDELAVPDSVDAADVGGDWHRAEAIEANNGTWELLERPDRSAADDEELLRRAYASAYHWQRATGRAAVNEVRALYMIAKAQLAVGNADAALEYGDRCLAECSEHQLADFDLAYAHEARARALSALGRGDEAVAEWALARAVPIGDPDDRAIVDADFADGP